MSRRKVPIRKIQQFATTKAKHPPGRSDDARQHAQAWRARLSRAGNQRGVRRPRRYRQRPLGHINAQGPCIVFIDRGGSKMFTNIGRLFKKPQQTFGSKPELFASFMAYQFLERGWDLPKELIDECLEDAGPDFRSMIKGWLLVYCAWLFRLA